MTKSEMPTMLMTPSPSPITIAIDGPAASGKGTLAKKLAVHYDFACLHTGLLYRTLAQALLRQDPKGKNIELALSLAHGLAQTIDQASLDQSDSCLHRQEISFCASRLAEHPEIRAHLTNYQRQFAAAPPEGKKGAILEGRDIGSVILPNADVKIFITAMAKVRAARRSAQLRESRPVSEIKREIIERDRRDKNRAVSPLIVAHHAHLLDTTKYDIDETFHRAVKIIQKDCAALSVGGR